MATPAFSTAYAVRAQAFNFSAPIVSSATDNPIAGGLTGLASTISIDDGTFVSTTNAAVEIATNSGIFSLDLTATEMTGSKILVKVSATNANAVTRIVSINPLAMAAFAGRYDAQASIRLEQLLLDLHAFLYNQQINDGASQVVDNPDGSTKVSGVIQTGDTQSVRTKLV